MASRRAATLALHLSRSNTSVSLQIPLQSFRAGPIIRASIIRRQFPSLVSIRQKHTIPRPPQQSATPSSSSAEWDPHHGEETAPADGEKPTSKQVSTGDNVPQHKAPQPQYELTFTCIPCGDRSKHKVSKQGYHHGSVLITCPGCRNRHVISDHLKIFGERGGTIEELMKERGQLVKKGTLGEDGDIEFWEDGTVVPRDDSPRRELFQQKLDEKKLGGHDKWLEEQRALRNSSEEKEAWEREPPGASFKKSDEKK